MSTTPADAKHAAKPRGLLIPIIAAVVVSAAIAGGAVFFIAGKHAAPAEGAEGGQKAAAGHEGGAAKGGEEKGAEAKGGKQGGTTYFALAPAFVVNLSDTDASRFLQIDMEIMTHDESVIDSVKLHSPQIRNSLLMLLAQQKLKDIDTREGKEILQKKVLDEIQRILTSETGKPGVEAVFFTSFVMQ